MDGSIKSETLRATVDGLALCATLFSPETRDDDQAQPKPTLFCLPGGGQSAEYFDLAPDYSFARRMAARGYRVLTMDHPGTVTNPLPDDHPFLTPRQSADYLTKALLQWRDEAPVIGIGHSMGGMIIMLMQGRHRPFAALGLLGSSAGGLDWGLDDHEKTYIGRPKALERDLEALTLRKFKTPFPEGLGGPSGKSITFGGETPAITQRLRDTACPLFAAGGMMSMTRGSFQKEAESLNVPLFFAFGDHDIGIPPADVPKDFPNAEQVELIILENTGHNSFAFASIANLCKRLDHWLDSRASVSRKR